MMRPVILLIVLLVSACTGTPEGSQTKSVQIINHEAPGNLQSRPGVGCIKIGVLRNTDTPADLYLSGAECVKQKDLDSAAYSYALAGVYARYDSMRVLDQTAHQAQAALRLMFADSLTDNERKIFLAKLSTIGKSPANLTTLCSRIRTIGPPNYHPTYMIHHGMSSFTGRSGDGLVPNFDSAASWEKSLDTYLHCIKS